MTQETSQIAAARIVGGVGTGKTQALIDRACKLLAQGAKGMCWWCAQHRKQQPRSRPALPRPQALPAQMPPT